MEWRGKRQTAVSGSRAANQGDGKFDWSSLRKRRVSGLGPTAWTGIYPN